MAAADDAIEMAGFTDRGSLRIAVILADFRRQVYRKSKSIPQAVPNTRKYLFIA